MFPFLIMMMYVVAVPVSDDVEKKKLCGDVRRGCRHPFYHTMSTKCPQDPPPPAAAAPMWSSCCVLSSW
jgi:hypothetical protein